MEFLLPRSLHYAFRFSLLDPIEFILELNHSHYNNHCDIDIDIILLQQTNNTPIVDVCILFKFLI